MPLIYVQRYGQTVITGSGTQYITGTLSFTGKTIIELDPTVFTQVGTYVLFDYSAGSFPGGQSALTTNVTVDATALPGVTGATLSDDPTNYRITVTIY